MPRPPKWSGPSRAIRVPEHLADHLLDIARQLDIPDNVQNPSEATATAAGLPTCKPKADAATIAQGLAEGWIAHKLPQYPQMLTSQGSGGTYRLFLNPPRPLPPQMEASLEDHADRVFDRLTECERIFLLARLVEELGEKVDA